MELRAKAFCTNCYEAMPYTINTSREETTVHEVSFSYLETQARCKKCNNLVYVPAVNDKNYYERHKAYYSKLNELKELELNGTN